MEKRDKKRRLEYSIEKFGKILTTHKIEKPVEDSQLSDIQSILEDARVFIKKIFFNDEYVQKGNAMKIIQVDLPEIGDDTIPPEVTIEEINNRLKRLHNMMQEKKYSHVVIYGDKEHFANLYYMTGGYDSRFEETLLIISREDIPRLIVGNEGLFYSNIAKLNHKKELFQTFSLQGMTRDKKVLLRNILKKCGLSQTSQVGIIGLKYYEEDEVEDPIHTYDIPHYIVKEIEKVVRPEQLQNATDLMIHPDYGLRSVLTHHEIARYECNCNYLSNQVRMILRSISVGMRETDILSHFNFKGIPFIVHPSVGFGTERVLMGLTSPSGNVVLRKGDPVNIGFAIEGASVARTGFAVSSRSELNEVSKTIVEDFYFPYYKAMKAWYELINVGVQSKQVYSAVLNILNSDKFGVSLNPGHTIHIEEWINSPFRTDRNHKLRSGMAFQCDIIAFPGLPFVGVHVEDTVAIADEKLKSSLRIDYPDTYSRIIKRQKMMRDILGISIGEDVLPFSNIQAVFNPFLLNSQYAITA